MPRTALLNSAGALATLCALATSGPAAGQTYVTFQVDNKSTSASAISAGGAVIGTACDFNCDAYVRAPDGTITSFSGPNAVDTEPAGINRKGSITGYFCESSDPCVAQGFVRKPDGKLVSFNPQ